MSQPGNAKRKEKKLNTNEGLTSSCPPVWNVGKHSEVVMVDEGVEVVDDGLPSPRVPSLQIEPLLEPNPDRYQSNNKMALIQPHSGFC